MDNLTNPQAPNHTAPCDDLLPVLWLCGAPAAGKSVTAWNLYRAHPDKQLAYIDIDQLKMLFPETGDPFRLASANLTTLAHQHRLLGTQALIVSGVIEPEELAQIDTALAADATVTWCLLDADDSTLRARVADRGWPDELANMVIADANALRATPIQHHIDTGELDPDAATQAANALLQLRDPRTATMQPSQEPVDSNLVVIYGPRAVGKSTLSWGVFMDCSSRGEATAYLDADQLGFMQTESQRRDQFLLEAIITMARTFTAAGAVRTIVNGNLSPALAAALAGPRTTLIELDASTDVIRQRITARHGGGAARLAGEDLEGATTATQSTVLAHALAQHDRYLAAQLPGHRLNTDGDEPSRHVDAILQLLTSDAARPAGDPRPTDYLGEPPAGGIDNGACCVIITGAPASGKTTLTRRLAETLQHSAWLNGDQIHWIIVGGRVWALEEPKDEADRQTRLGNDNLVALAENCAAARFTPIIDWIIPDATQLDQFVTGLAPLPVWLIVLDPGAEACQQRNLQREDRFEFDHYDELVGGMRDGFGDRAWWLDSSEQDADTTFQQILKKADPAAH